ncbi:MAG: hypothetical protein HPY79_06125 [Bacteroidales bacterium]|nr:hypothetical protein [Bacteroidales bacterium]
MKKNITSIILLALFELYSLGLFVHFKIIQIQIKSEIICLIQKNKVPLSAIECYNYNAIKSKVFWYEEAKEFSFNKKMYDVLFIKSDTNNQTLLYVIQDKKEDELIHNFNQKYKKDLLSWFKNYTSNFIFIINQASIKFFQIYIFENISIPLIFYIDSVIEKYDQPPEVKF